MKQLTFCLGALRTNTYFCYDDDGNSVVIDPGMDAEGILEKLKTRGLVPSHILLTHGHFDHSQAAKFLAEQTGAKICIHRDDAVMLENPGFNSAVFYYRGDISFYPKTKPDMILEEGSVLQVGSMRFRVLHTPGHTPGSVCFETDDVLFCGDTVFAYGFGRYDLWGGDRELLAGSLERIAQIKGEKKLCPGHGNTATLSRVREEILENAAHLK